MTDDKTLDSLMNTAKKELGNKFKEASDACNYYTGDEGFVNINTALRNGKNIKDVAKAQELESACIFSSDTDFDAMRGEWSPNDNWKGIKVGDKLPKALRDGFLSVTTSTEYTHENFQNLEGVLEPGENFKSVYNTTIKFKVPKDKKFAIPSAMNTEGTTARRRSTEQELILPPGTTGTITKVTTEKSYKSMFSGVEIHNQTIEITLE